MLEKEQRKKIKQKSWLENVLICGSGCQRYTEKIKPSSKIDISELENTDNEYFQSKKDKEDYVDECE